MRTLVLGQKPEPKPEAKAEGAPAVASEGQPQPAAPPPAPPQPVQPQPVPVQAPPESRPPTMIHADLHDGLTVAEGPAPAGPGAAAASSPPPPPPQATPPAPAAAALADPLLPIVAQLREITSQPEQIAEWRRRQAAARAAEAMRWLDAAADRQLQAYRLRRELLQAKINPKGAGARSLAAGGGAEREVTARAKPLLQRLYGELERGLANTDGIFLGVPAGTLIRELEELADRLEELDMHIRATAIATRIPRAFEDDVNRHIRERLFEHFSHDLKAINDLFQHSAKEVEQMVEKEGGLPSSSTPS
jgi:hypothetical protein